MTEHLFVEDVALERLKALAKHHGWTHEDCIWRIFNLLANQDEPYDFATAIWSIDNVASIETEMRGREYKPMLDSVLPANREFDDLHGEYLRQAAEHKARVKANIKRRGRNKPAIVGQPVMNPAQKAANTRRQQLAEKAVDHA